MAHPVVADSDPDFKVGRSMSGEPHLIHIVGIERPFRDLGLSKAKAEQLDSRLEFAVTKYWTEIGPTNISAFSSLKAGTDTFLKSHAQGC